MNKKKILIVEDEKSIRAALRDKLEREGYEVGMAGNGVEALDAISVNQPDLILLDIVMPKMDGMQVMRHLKADERMKHIPIIFLTNLSDAEKVEEAIQHGVYDYLVKAEWTLEDMCKKIKDKIL